MSAPTMPPTREEIMECYYLAATDQTRYKEAAVDIARLVAWRAVAAMEFLIWYQGTVCVTRATTAKAKRMLAAWKAAADGHDGE